MRPLALALVAALAAASALPAQRVLGPTSDATTLRRGTLRTAVTGENILLRGRWSDGVSEPLGGGLSVAFDADRVDDLATVRDLLAGLGRADVVPSLGSSRVHLRQRLAVTRLGLEYGLTDRITLRAQAPFVRARAEAQLGFDPTGMSAGLNPILSGSGVAAANRAVVDAYGTAAAGLAQRRSDCAGNPAAHAECATIIAEDANVQAAIARGTQLAAALATIYGAQGLGGGLRYVPAQMSVPHLALMGIGMQLQQDFQRWGVNSVTDATGFPLGAQAPITAAELARLVTSADSGLGARLPRRSTKQDLGDVDLGVTVRLFDAFAGDSARLAAGRFGLRQSLGLTYRLGRGAFDIPDNLTDLGTGSGHDAIALHSYTDIIVNARFWATVTLGWARAATHERVARVPLIAGVELVGLDREVPVRIVPADLYELRVAPRWIFNDYLGVGAEWRFRTRGRDAVRSLGDPSVTLPAGVALPYGDGGMQTPSDANEQRWAWTLSYSTVGSNARGVARLPFELLYTHEQSVASSRGVVPRRWEDRITLRYYARLFGR